MQQPLDSSRKHDSGQVIVGKKKGSLVGACRHHYMTRPQMNQAFGRTWMRIGLKNSEKVAFVKAEAIGVLQNPDISSSLEPRNEIAWYRSRTFAISELP